MAIPRLEAEHEHTHSPLRAMSLVAVIAALLAAGMVARDLPRESLPSPGRESAMAPAVALRAAGTEGSVVEAAQLPLFSIAPVYPPEAEAAGVAGRCVVEYTIGRSGATQDVRALDCEPAGVFEASAIGAAQQFKYRPRTRDGEPVETPGVRNEFLFTLER
ncbi:MAG: energy transducer TonB [Planctomycetota bacterium]